MGDDIVTRIREEAKKQTTLGQAFDLLHVADEIEQLRGYNADLQARIDWLITTYARYDEDGLFTFPDGECFIESRRG